MFPTGDSGGKKWPLPGEAGSEVWNRVYMIAPVKNLTEWDWTLKLAFRWRKKMAADSRYSGIWNVIIVNDCTERKTD